MISEETIACLKIVWDYMVLNIPIKPCDLIMGCGSKSLITPVYCSELWKQGYGKKILFSGGFGKITHHLFEKPEAKKYQEIAIKLGIPKDAIIIEDKSTNTGDNFKFSIKLLEKKKVSYESILIVHNNFSQRRTLNTAKANLKGKEILITSPKKTFEQFKTELQEKTQEVQQQIISVIVGDIQRIIIFPQFGWQVEDEVPEEVRWVYQKLKQMGYDTYVYKKEKIRQLIEKHGIVEGKKTNYFV